MDDLSDMDNLKKLADTQIRDKSRIEGKIESLEDELNDEGFSSVNAANKAMVNLAKKIEKMEDTFKNKVKLFKDKHAGELAKIRQ